ncbi:hypothetical protein EVAR_23200_1 [Eumeta japonica]|uniref:Uncharacterized protein n=1 Tax=Eumeta variegata TaxID=151549 RepID=A0A4C1VCM7_EUMVA|nr:hypothetical protein EVAR_23200_1 [Eumeta japonica]
MFTSEIPAAAGRSACSSEKPGRVARPRVRPHRAVTTMDVSHKSPVEAEGYFLSFRSFHVAIEFRFSTRNVQGPAEESFNYSDRVAANPILKIITFSIMNSMKRLCEFHKFYGTPRGSADERWKVEEVLSIFRHLLLN